MFRESVSVSIAQHPFSRIFVKIELRSSIFDIVIYFADNSSFILLLLLFLFINGLFSILLIVVLKF